MVDEKRKGLREGNKEERKGEGREGGEGRQERNHILVTTRAKMPSDK
jgi:hypothetical protein